MHNAITTLQNYKIPTGSYIRAIQEINEDGELSHNEYVKRCKELVGADVELDEKTDRYVYLYLVQETIRKSFTTDQLNMIELFEQAKELADKFCKENPYVFATSVDFENPKLDANGNPKKKKGAKKELAKKIWSENQGKNLTRKQWIELLIEEVGLTPGGASTYHANLKAGRF